MELKPIYYRHYAEDTFALFKSKYHLKRIQKYKKLK